MIENTKQNLENRKEEEKTECRVFFDVTSNTLKGKIIDEAIGLSAVIINETGENLNRIILLAWSSELRLSRLLPGYF